MLRGTLICGRDGAVQTRSLCSWPTLVCTVRTLHKTGPTPMSLPHWDLAHAAGSIWQGSVGGLQC